MVRGHVSGALGRLEEARQAWGVALQRYLYAGYLNGCAWDALSGVALWFARAGQVERAVELYALCLKDPFVAHSRWHEDVCGRPIAAAAASLPPEVVQAAQERGRAREWLATFKRLQAEFGTPAETEGRPMWIDRRPASPHAARYLARPKSDRREAHCHSARRMYQPIQHNSWPPQGVQTYCPYPRRLAPKGALHRERRLSQILPSWPARSTNPICPTGIALASAASHSRECVAVTNEILRT